MFRNHPIFFIRLPDWLLKAHRYAKRKQLYLSVPLFGLAVSNYWKDYKINDYSDEADILKSSINVLVSNQISRAGVIEQTDLIFWVKELVGDEYRVVYISPEYERFLKEGVSRLDLLGRTFRYFDEEFADIYQKNDKKASKLDNPEVFPEPYKLKGVGEVFYGDFLKGRLSNTGNRVLVFGLYIKDSKNQK